MKVNTDIRNLCDGLDEKFLKELDAEPEAEEGFDTERIKHLAFEKLCSNEEVKKKESNRGMKRISYKILMVAALLVVVTTSVFAMGGMEFFRSIFINSEQNLEKNIQQVGVSARDTDYEMVAEQLISDGFNTKIVVSLKPLSEEAKALLADPETTVQILVSSETDNSNQLSSTGTTRLSQFDSPEKYYFCVMYMSNAEYSGKPITLKLYTVRAEEDSEESSEAREPLLSLVIKAPEQIDGRKNVAFDIPEDPEGPYPVSLIINPTSGVMVTQDLQDAKSIGVNVDLIMKDGKIERILEEGGIGEGSGGGETLLAEPENMPLSSGRSYSKDKSTNQVVQTVDFSRIIDVDKVDYVLIDGERYELK